MSASRDDFGIAFRSALLQKGARQKFSLFFFICSSILILFIGNISSNISDTIRKILNDGIYRTSLIASSPVKLVENSLIFFKSYLVVHKKNKILTDEIEKLKFKNFKFKFLTAENKKLKENLMSSNDFEYSYVNAKVLMDKESPFLKSIIINKGAKSKILKGMPVVDGSHLVGRVVEVNYLSSRVLLLNDLNSRIPIVIESTADQAILTGDGNEMPILEYLPETYIVKKNQVTFTSGKDGFFPAGIAVGITFSVENEKNKKKDFNNFEEEKKTIKVKLFSNASQLSFVKVLLSDIKIPEFSYGNQ